jgi:kynurenine formamidase
LLHDNSYKYDIETHSHVGTHVEGGRHFYGDPDDEPDTETVTGREDNRSLVEYPLESFYGPGVLFPVTAHEITDDVCEEAIGDRLEPGDIVVARNELGGGDREDVYEDDAPAFTESAGHWLAARDVKAIVFGNVGLGHTREVGNVFHDVAQEEAALFDAARETLDGDAGRSDVEAWIETEVEPADTSAAQYLSTILDVPDPEPLPTAHPLWTLGNCLITPHVGGSTPRHWERMADIVADNLAALESGGDYRNLVAPPE